MKKLASIVLVIAMLFVLSISAFATTTKSQITITDEMTSSDNNQKLSGGENLADSGSTGLVGQTESIPVYVDMNTNITETDSIYTWCVDVFWESMTFTVTKTAAATSWDTTKLQYNTGSEATYQWTDEGKNNEIDIENRSNRDIHVGLSYSSGFDTITGGFYTLNAEGQPVALTSTDTIPSAATIQATTATSPELAGAMNTMHGYHFEFEGESSAVAAALFTLKDSGHNQFGSITVTINGIVPTT